LRPYLCLINKYQMNQHSPLQFREFGRDSLSGLPPVRQSQYLVNYLEHLGAAVVLEESNYFDRDYLSEFASFYGTSSRGYGNTCRRLHFFSDAGISRQMFVRCTQGSARSLRRLKDAYLGFVILRPIPAAPLGRTVLRWYPEHTPDNPRVTSPSRIYSCHVAGVQLEVYGLAWQQQDQAVSACATVGIWSMLHSSALDDHHLIPTTAEITITANKRVALGSRTFPSTGLTLEQLLEAIKDHRLAPLIISGEGQPIASSAYRAFGRERFASSVASLIRSGYPVLLIGMLEGAGLHAICATGFRSSPRAPIPPNEIALQDHETTHLYVHDDNIGPNVRFKLEQHEGITRLETDPPASAGTSSPTLPYPKFSPTHLIAAVHDDLRMSPDFVHKEGIERASRILNILNILLDHLGKPRIGVTLSTRFIAARDYVGAELGRLLDPIPRLLGRVRLTLREKVPPMSPHLAVVRVAVGDSKPLVDILYDTTDTGINQPVFASVVYSKDLLKLIPYLPNQDFGCLIDADL
jgi:hypothetical protein